MEPHSNVVRLRQPDAIDDPLTEVLQTGVRQLLAQAVELEVEAFLAERAGLRLPDGRARLVGYGHAPERAVQTGIGAVAVARPKVRDCGADVSGERADPVYLGDPATLGAVQTGPPPPIARPKARTGQPSAPPRTIVESASARKRNSLIGFRP